MILTFILKEWKGIASGASVVLVLALMGMGSMYSVIKVQSGSISKLESKVDGLKIDIETCDTIREQDRITCEDVAEESIKQQDAVAEWMLKHEESSVRFSELTRLANERDREGLRDLEDEQGRSENAIRRAESVENKIRAFAGSILGAAIE